MSERWRVALLLAVAALVYGNTLLNGFTLDDNLYILNNPMVTRFSWGGLFHTTSYNNVFRPLTFGAFALNWAIGGDHPIGYHLFDLLLHAIVCLLLYLVLRRLLQELPQGTSVAWAAALIFAVHPIHTEAVASIAGRSELLAVGFLLAAWLLHLYDRQIPAAVCFVLALLSKESAVAFVPLALAGDYVRDKLKPLHRHAVFAAMAAAYLGMLWKVQGGRFGEKAVNFLDNPLASLPAKLRILNALRIAWKYVGLQIYPVRLSSDYSYNAILLYANWQHTAPAAIATVLVLGLWVWALWTQRKEWVFAGAIYFAGFAVTANILVPTGTIMGERLAYLPSAGFCLLVALLWVQLENRQRMPAWGLLVLLLVALGTRTVLRNRDWQDNFSLFAADVRTVPRSAKVHSNLGAQYFSLGRFEEADSELRTAIRIYPDLPDAMGYLGLSEVRLGHDQEGSRLLTKAVSMTAKDNPNYDFIAVNLAAVLMKRGEDESALKILNDEIAANPVSSRAWSNRAVIRFQRGDYASARSDADSALRIDPSNTQAQNLLAALSNSAPAR